MVKTLPSNAEGAGSIPGQGAKILHASQPKNQKQYCNKFNEDLLFFKSWASLVAHLGLLSVSAGKESAFNVGDLGP